MCADRRCGWLVGAIAVLVTSTTHVASAERVRLTVAESYARAQRHSFQLKRRHAEQGAAVARRGQVRGQFFPRLELTARFSRVQRVEPGIIDFPSLPGEEGPTFGEPISSITVFRGELAQPLFTGFETERRYEAARLGVELAGEQRRVAELDLQLEVEQVYFGTYLALELETVARQGVDVLAVHLASIHKLYDVGRATELELALAEARLADAEVTLEEAREGVAASQAALTTLLALPPGTIIELAEAPDARESAPSELAERALANRPELRIARVSSQVEATQVGVARADHWPRVSALAGYTYANPNDRFYPPAQEFNGSWNVTIAAAWTLDWGITRQRVAEARANASAAAHQVSALEDQTRIDAARTEASLSTADRRVIAARKSVDAATRAFAAAQRTFELGRLESTQLLDRELELRRARARLLQALVDRRMAHARARRLIGVAQRGD